MKIQAENYIINLSKDELFSIAVQISLSIQHRVNDHYKFCDDNWKDNEKDALYIMQSLFNALGDSKSYEQIVKDYDKIVSDFKTKKEQM